MRHPETDDAFRREVCDWFRANGVDPGRLPLNPDAAVADGQLTFRRVVWSDLTDTARIDPRDPNSMLTVIASVPLVVEPSPDIAEWLQTRCPTCGR